MFSEDLRLAPVIYSPCRRAEDFRIKIGGLENFVDNMNTKKLRELIKNPDKEKWKSVRLLEEWIKETGMTYVPDAIQTLRDIIDLRNASWPYHPDDSRVINILRRFGISYRLISPFCGTQYCKSFYKASKKSSG